MGKKRKVNSIFFLVIGLIIGHPAMAANINFVIDAQPLSILYAPKAEDLTAYGSGIIISESFEGNVSWFPSIRAGIGIDSRAMNIDFTVGGGYISNDVWSSALGRGDVALHFKLGNIITLGPHVGVGYFMKPEFENIFKNLEFSNAVGFIGGLDFSVGKMVSFLLSIDYVSASFDVEAEPGWSVSDNSMDISGFAIQAGIMGRF